MATWVRQGTGTAPSVTNGDLSGRYSLDNGTAPGDFNPAGVTQVDFAYTITGASFSDDSWDDLRAATLDDATNIAASIDGTDATGLGNTGSNTNESDTSPNTGLTVAQWEAMAVSGGTGVNGIYTSWNQSGMPDGGTQTMSALTVTITYTPLPAQASQTNFRVRTEDTVALNSTTFAAALNTNPSAIDVLGGDVTIRLRFEIDEINSLDLTDGYQLRASKNSGAYAVPASVSGVTSVNSSQYTDGDATTNVLSGSGRTFQAGEGVGSDNVTGTITALNNEHTELEFCVRLDSASLANNDTLDFRVYFDDGTALTSYTNTPRITISKVVPTRLTDWQFRSHANFTQAVNSATFGTTKNVAPTLNPSRGFRLRAALEAGSFSNTVKLQYRINTGTWTDVAVNTPGDASARTATSPVELRWYTTPSVDGTATTQLIGNGTFTAGEINDSAIATGTISLTNQETEIEWVLWFHRFSDVSSAEQISDGDTLEFRMVAGASTVIDPETANPSLTVDYPAGYIGGQVVENPTNHFAPIEDGNGNLYIFNERAESNPVWFIQKSTDQGVSWTPLDTANGPTITDYEGSDFFLANGGTEIWVLHHPGDSPRMYRFATSTHATTPDVWLDATGEQIDTAILDVIDQSIAGGLRSDGTVVAIYTGGATATHTVYANIRSSGGTWGTPFLVWTPAASEEWGHGVTGVLVGDDFYAVNNEDSVGALYGKRISSADALEDWAGTSVAASANGTLIDNAVDTGITGRQAWIGPIATGSSSLAVGGIDDTSFDGFLRHVTNLGGVGGSLTVGSRGAAINPDGDLQSGLGNSRRAQAAIAQASNGDIVVIYAKGTGQTATTSTLHYRISTDNGSTWGTETDITTVTTPARGWGSRIEMIGVRIDEDDIARVYYQDGSLAEEDDYNSSDTVGGLVTGFGWYLEIDMATGGAVTGAGTANAASDTTATTSVARVAQAIGNQASDTTGVGFVDRLGAATANAATDATGSAVVDRFAAGSADQAAEAVATAITAAFQSGAGTANAASDASASASVERSGAATANQASDAAGLSVVGRFGAASANQATDATANGTVAALEEGAGSADQAVEAIASAAVLYQAAGSADQASDVSANGTTAAGILGAGSANQATDATASAAVLRQGAASADQATDTTGVSSVERFAASSANQAEAASASSAVARFGAATADQACETAGSASATFSAVGSANQAFDAAGQFNLFVSLYANGDGTIADVVDENDLTTNIWQSIDDDPQSPTDTDWINNAATAASTFIALTDMPSSFVSASAARVQARYRGQQFGSGTVTLYAQLFQSDESTSLSDEAAVSAVTSDGAFENTAEFAITGLNTSASKAVWDAALIRFRWETT